MNEAKEMTMPDLAARLNAVLGRSKDMLVLLSRHLINDESSFDEKTLVEAVFDIAA